MPEVFRLFGFTFHIFHGDHEPRHTHVIKAGGEVKIDLGQLSDPDAGAAWVAPVICKNKGMARSDAKEALRLVYQYQAELLKKWEEVVDARF
jgi:hypothetical protein